MSAISAGYSIEETGNIFNFHAVIPLLCTGGSSGKLGEASKTHVDVTQVSTAKLPVVFH